jgi:hypothetical protein
MDDAHRVALAELVDAAWIEWSRARHAHGDVVPEQSAPVLWFGDLERYLASPSRIVTIGVNPGPGTFPQDGQWQFYPDLAGGNRPGLAAYVTAMSGFPLSSWFPGWNGLLAPLGARYPQAVDGNAPLHLDLTPICTSWVFSDSRVAPAARQALLEHGMVILSQLLGILRPEFAFLSVKADYYLRFIDGLGMVGPVTPWHLGGHSGVRAILDTGCQFLWLRKTGLAPVSAGIADQIALGQWMLRPPEVRPPQRDQGMKVDKIPKVPKVPKNPHQQAPEPAQLAGGATYYQRFYAACNRLLIGQRYPMRLAHQRSDHYARANGHGLPGRLGFGFQFPGRARHRPGFVTFEADSTVLNQEPDFPAWRIAKQVAVVLGGMTPVVGANGLTWRIFIPAVDATEHDVEDQAVIDRAARGTVEVLLKAMGAYRRLDDEYPR